MSVCLSLCLTVTILHCIIFLACTTIGVRSATRNLQSGQLCATFSASVNITLWDLRSSNNVFGHVIQGRQGGGSDNPLCISTVIYTLWPNRVRLSRWEPAGWLLSYPPYLDIETVKYILKLFSTSGNPSFLVFPYQTLWQYSDKDILTAALNAGEKNRDF